MRHKSKSCYWIALCCALVFGILFTVQAINGLFSDDFYYMTFWREGPAHFMELVVDHFKTFNGRVLVHLVAQTVLAFPMWVFALVNTALLLGGGLLATRLQDGEAKGGVLWAGVTLFGAQLLLIGPETMKESLLWVSASYNYMLPVMMLVAGLWCWQRWLRTGPWYAAFWVLLLQFLCGATTEQCGALAVGGTLLVGLHWIIKERPKPGAMPKALLGTLLSLAGYGTIFLSPATQARMGRKVDGGIESLFSDLPRWAAEHLAPDGIVPVLVIFCLAAALYALGNKRRRWPLFAGVPVAGVLLWGAASGRTEEEVTTAFLVFLAFLILTSLLLFFGTERGMAGVLVACAVASALIMLPTHTFGTRTTLPLVLLLALVSAGWLSEGFREGIPVKSWMSASALCLGCALCAVVFLPTLKGYWSNHLLDLENEVRVEEARETGVLVYRIDYDTRYGHMRMYQDGYFYRTFLESKNLWGHCSVDFISNELPAVYVGEKRLPSPVWIGKDGMVCFPVVQLLQELGGEANYIDIDHVDYTLGDRLVSRVYGSLFCSEPGREDWRVIVTGQVSERYCLLCYSEKVMEDAFGLTFTLRDGDYVLNQ